MDQDKALAALPTNTTRYWLCYKALLHVHFSTDLRVLLNHVLRSRSHEEIEVEDPSNSAES